MKILFTILFYFSLTQNLFSQDTLVHFSFNSTFLFLEEDSTFEYYQTQCMDGYIYGRGKYSNQKDSLIFNFERGTYLRTQCTCISQEKMDTVEFEIYDLLDSIPMEWYRCEIAGKDTIILGGKSCKLLLNQDSIKFKFMNPNKDFTIHPYSENCSKYEIRLSEFKQCTSLNQLVLIKKEEKFLIKSATRNGIFIPCKRSIKWINTIEYRRKMLEGNK